MTQFVKQAEPEYVGPFVSNAQLDYRLSSNPLSGALHACFWQMLDKDKRDAAAREQLRHAGTKNRRRLAGKTPKLWDCFRKNVTAKWGDLERFARGRDLSGSAPCGLKFSLLDVLERAHAKEAEQFDGAVEPVLDVRHPPVRRHLSIGKLSRKRDFSLLQSFPVMKPREILAV